MNKCANDNYFQKKVNSISQIPRAIYTRCIGLNARSNFEKNNQVDHCSRHSIISDKFRTIFDIDVTCVEGVYC